MDSEFNKLLDALQRAHNELNIMKDAHLKLQRELELQKVHLQEKADKVWSSYLSEKHKREELEDAMTQLLSSNFSSDATGGLFNAKVVIENMLQETESIKAENSALRSENELLRNQKQKYQDEVSYLKSEAITLSNKIDEIKEENQALKDKVNYASSVSSKVTELNKKELETLSAQNQEWMIKYQQTEKLNASLKANILKFEEENYSLKAKFTEANTLLLKAQGKLTEIKKKAQSILFAFIYSY